ncbi:MAG: nucleotide pyrophosphohydrolase [Bacillota bacterium]
MSKVLEELMHEIIRFRDERDWKQFHKPKDLALSLSIEAAELLECFQWKNDEDIEKMLQNEDKIKIEEEVADIAAYLILLCDSMDIDLLAAIKDKIEKNRNKYPVEKCKGKADKYTEL